MDAKELPAVVVRKQLGFGDLLPAVAVVAIYRWDRWAPWRLHSVTLTAEELINDLHWCLIHDNQSRYHAYELIYMRVIEGEYSDVFADNILWNSKHRPNIGVKPAEVLRLVMRAFRKGFNVTVRHKRVV